MQQNFHHDLNASRDSLSSWCIFIFCPQSWLWIRLSVCAFFCHAWSSLIFSLYTGSFRISLSLKSWVWSCSSDFVITRSAKVQYMRLNWLAVTPPNDPAGRINSQQLRDRQVSLSFLTSTARNLSPEYPEHSPLLFSSATSSSLMRLMGQNIILSTAYWKSTCEKGEGEINVRKSCKQARLNCSHLHLPTLQIAK